MSSLSPTIVKAVVAVGGLVLLALLVMLVILSGRDSAEPVPLADSMAGQPTEVLEGEGTATVWVSGADAGDPRPGGQPDPGSCTVKGSGAPKLVEPDSSDSTVLGETTLYPIAQVEDFAAPLTVVCSGDSFKHVYVTG